MSASGHSEPARRIRATPTASRPGSPHAVSHQLNDFEQFSDLFGRWGGTFHQMSRGRFRGNSHVVAGQQVRAFEATTNQSILTRGVDSADFATFIPITPRNADTLWHGRRLPVGSLLAKGPEAEYWNRTPKDACIRAVLVPMPIIRATMRSLGDDEPALCPASWQAQPPPPATLARFERCLDQLFVLGSREPGVLATLEGLELEAELLASLVRALMPPRPRHETGLRGGSRNALIKCAVDLIHSRMHRPLTAVELCRTLGASDRTLRRAFFESFGMGPMAYLRLMRLHGARTALRRARGSCAKVAEIARYWGFHRLGAFAADYRTQFGELPSVPLGIRGHTGM
jgi:AraC family ethanolamine operon transcriptional activator